MASDDKRIQAVHNTLMGMYSDIPKDFNTFKKDLQDPKKAKIAHNVMSSKFSDIPKDFNTFYTDLGYSSTIKPFEEPKIETETIPIVDIKSNGLNLSNNEVIDIAQSNKDIAEYTPVDQKRIQSIRDLKKPTKEVSSKLAEVQFVTKKKAEVETAVKNFNQNSKLEEYQSNLLNLKKLKAEEVANLGKVDDNISDYLKFTWKDYKDQIPDVPESDLYFRELGSKKDVINKRLK
jgi:hypothetical protein